MFDVLSKVPKLGPVDYKVVLSDIYESKYGIYNHIGASNRRPLSSVAFHSSENINNGSLLEARMRMYVHKKIRSIFGLSFDEFLDKPRDVMEMLLKIADEENSRMAHNNEEIEEQFRKITGK